MVTEWDYTGTYLEQFPANYKGAVGNEFCAVIREGNITPFEVINALWARINRNRTELRNLIAPTLSQPEASKFAAFLVARESMPYEQRARLKETARAEKGKEFARASMEAKLPTDKQLALLRKLNVSTIPRTRLEASDLIEVALHGNLQE